MKHNPVDKPPLIALVVPCHNEQEVLPITDRELATLMDGLIGEGCIDPGSFRLYVDDGSTDNTWQVIESLADDRGDVRAIGLTANTGQQNALMAGLEEVAGKCDAVITLDADMQDDINAISTMIAMFRAGNEIVYGVRESRNSDTWFKRTTAQTFYRFMAGAGVPTIFNHAEFRLMSADALDDFLGYGERNLYIRGIVPLLGREHTTVPYARGARAAGKTKYSFGRMVNFALDGITSFSVRPVRWVFFIGLLFLAIALCLTVYVMIRFAGGHTNPGWTSLMLSIWFCSGTVLICLGFIGEYIAKIYTEVKHRPRYHVRRRL